MPPPRSQTFEVRAPSDVGAARRAARAAARELGFELKAAEELALAMTELATNLLKHARAGKLSLRPLSQGHRVGLEVESLDQGPGILEARRVLADGFSTTGTRGTGLGAVNRLMDEFDLDSHPDGTRITCRKWRRAHQPSPRPCPLSFGVATRPYPGCAQNGDAFVLCQWEESALVGVIDGLGHGPGAHRAAEAARQYAESHYDLPLARLFAGVGRACQATRGVVMALARFDWAERTLAFGSVGDIEVRVSPRGAGPTAPVQRGILGLNAPQVRVSQQPWDEGHVLVLHSDGLRSHWGWKDFPGLLEKPAPVIAKRLLQALASERDDATVLVVRKAMP